jgi:hypothetical protein
VALRIHYLSEFDSHNGKYNTSRFYIKILILTTSTSLDFLLLFREQGTGNREQGTGNREQGTGNREQGTVDKN